MDIQPLSLNGLYQINYNAFRDERGAFKRIFCTDACQKILSNRSLVQINQSSNTDVGTVRGMHLQNAPFAEMKFVQCIKGRVMDVAVDVRENSSTFLQHYALELSGDDDIAFVIPEGFAHGFQVLEPNSELLYFHTCEYSPNHGMTINPSDPKVNIQWPLPMSNISEKDKNQAFLNDDFKGIKL